MGAKKVTVIYWAATILFSLAMLLDGLAGALRVAGALEALADLGYPEYVSTIVGVAKICGSVALLQTVFHRVREWAYAGFAFVLSGAFLSHAFVGSGIGFLVLPVIMLAIMFLSYFLWKKVEREKL